MIDATPLLRLRARWRLRQLRRMDPRAAQENQLRQLLKTAAGTRFGQAHDFGRLRTVEDFQKAVPLRRYEDFWTEWWKPAFPAMENATWPGRTPYLAVSSGTTAGRTKFIPVTKPMAKANQRAVLDLLSFHVAARPNTRILGGRSFMLGGTTIMEDEGDGVLSGDLTGIAAREVPAWARSRYYPPGDLARIADWDEKMAALGADSVERDIRLIGGTASWLLLFLERTAGRPAEDIDLRSLYPGLEMVVYGGVNFEPYRERYQAMARADWGTRPVDLREVYPASEGFIACADRGVGEGLRLFLDNGLFLEFVPVEELDSAHPRRFWVGNVEAGVTYAVIVSSNAGVWSYVLGDAVRFVDLDPPRVIVAGRTAYTLSAFGEHLEGEEIEAAVTTAARHRGRAVSDWSVGALYPERAGHQGGHLYVVEFAGEPPPDNAQARRFIADVDARLQDSNDDYRVHRTGTVGMDPPRLLVAAPGTFAAWMKARGRAGGQNKVPRVIADRGLFRQLCEFARDLGAREVEGSKAQP
ncbi:GH3 auxin-responsive promoter family protein [Caenispirillum salinarum]|uniref:GH3 family domain-containing protein n=1 Tax=Caenispirillum salinarum TaxID=859058 RepID=UPI00384FF287